MTQKELMEMAFLEGEKSSEPLKCGCVIAKDGEIIASEHNTLEADSDATAHDGIKAISAAGKKAGSRHLPGCEVYCSIEPCSMCLSAFIYAQVDKVYYSIPLDEVVWPNRIQTPSQEIVDKAPHKIELIQISR